MGEFDQGGVLLKETYHYLMDAKDCDEDTSMQSIKSSQISSRSQNDAVCFMISVLGRKARPWFGT